MRIFLCLLSAAITIALIVVLNTPLTVGGGKTPRLGYFLSPQKGFWQNAEPADAKFDGKITIDSMLGKADVYFDSLLVPHIYAGNEADAYFVQGYLHAKFRLWQMEFQAYAAAGRLSEIFGAENRGTNFLNKDIFFRRLGMVYAAENSLKAMEADENTKTALDSYTAGVNAYINTLDEAHYPFEYKLLDYKPEPWTNLKCALFLKYMSYDLTGGDDDFEMTNAKAIFTKAQFEKLWPYGQDSVQNIIPKGTPFAKPGITLKVPETADSLYFNYKDTIAVKTPPKPDPDNGSNNWAVAGSKTQSGRPILCSDPHLGLNLPSLWYEVQISTPSHNVYGVSFPGAPAVIIGFNDSCAWGVTNAGRDVKDYYEITFQDTTMTHYLYNYEWKKAEIREEVIKVKGQPDHIEKIAMTVWGPVMYDKNYNGGGRVNNGKAYACHWTAHDGSNELKTFIKLDHAKNIDDYKDAVATFKNPGQNFVFATKSNTIAIKEAGGFPAKWRRQGDFVMPGKDSSYAMQVIPDSENVLLVNPPSGYVSSANQYAYDTSYPYYLGGLDFEYIRPNIINRNLAGMQHITPEDMQHLQTDNYNLLAEMARPALLKYLNTKALTDSDLRYVEIFKDWNLRNDANEEGPIIFANWWDSVKYCMYNDEMMRSRYPVPAVGDETMLRALRKDSIYEFADDINTPQKETLKDVVTMAFSKIVPRLKQAEKDSVFSWGKYKNSVVMHLLKIPALSRLNMFTGGGRHIINANSKFNGPSWRMVVQLTDKTEAYGLYPGGQNGNPGSKYYETFIDRWAAGKYYAVNIFTKADMQKQPGNLGVITFSKK